MSATTSLDRRTGVAVRCVNVVQIYTTAGGHDVVALRGVNLDIQKAAFEGMFAALWGKPWFGGTFVWKWHPAPRAPAPSDAGFTPQGKPALAVIRSSYLK